MVIRRTIWLIIFSLLMPGLVPFSHAQKTDAFARVSLNKRSVYSQQPIRATVTVYTVTWFTKALDFDNIQIPNAFIIPFSRTLPGMYTINGKQYAGLEFYYLIFPYKPGKYELPVINVTAYTPPDGGFEGVKVNLKTSPVSYEVKEIPGEFNSDSWFVARGMKISDHWNKPTGDIKVGDVLVRTITISARGTLPGFIPQILPEAPPHVSLYPDEPRLIDQRDDESANGTRVEQIKYLFEKEGKVSIPGLTIQWWDAIRQATRTEQTSAIEITVKANPDLGILASVRDSLDVTKKSQVGPTKVKGPLMILGLIWWKAAIVGAVGLLVAYFLFRIIRKLTIYIKGKSLEYRESEAYWFKRFQNSGDSPPELIDAFYAWWDRLKGVGASVRVSEKKPGFLVDFQNVEQALGSDRSLNSNKFKAGVKLFRKEMIKEMRTDRNLSDRQQSWED